MTETTNAVESITVTIAGNVWSDWQSPIDAGPGSTDTRASTDAFCSMVERTIEAHYPEAIVSVDAASDETDDRIMILGDDVGDTLAYAESAIEQIIDVTWQHSDAWVVLVAESPA